jgi:catechol 2,3-dioxygenase-like lactoylglutathione lyase family enzyme
MGMTLKRVDVIVLFVADVERAKTFYRDTFGLHPDEEDAEGAFIKLDTMFLALLGPAAAQDLLTPEAVARQPATGASSQLVAFVDDVHAVYAELIAQGVEFVREPTDRAWGLRTAHFKDPDGHIWELAQPIATGEQAAETAQAVTSS